MGQRLGRAGKVSRVGGIGGERVPSRRQTAEEPLPAPGSAVVPPNAVSALCVRAVGCVWGALLWQDVL